MPRLESNARLSRCLSTCGLVLGVLACNGTNSASLSPSAPAAQSGSAALNCDAAAPVPLSDAQRVVAKRCASCHSPTGAAGPDYDWTNERSLIAHRRNVAAQLSQDSMPPPGYPRPTPEERRTLVCWAKQLAG